jgi:hypothetical protein
MAACEHDNEPSGYIKCRELLDSVYLVELVRVTQILKNKKQDTICYQFIFVMLNNHTFPADVEGVFYSSWADIASFWDEHISFSSLGIL